MSEQLKKAIITVDTEAPCGNSAVDCLIYGNCRNGRSSGIELLMKVFSEHGIRAVFFVDIAEAWSYGKDKISSVLKCVKESGHDVGVHIHPDHMFDRKRRYLWQYTYTEQKDIISRCTQFYMDVLKTKPVSFRAGRYGVNYDTLDIISELGYTYDMSSFFGQKNCKLTPPITNNRIVAYKSIHEVPVTSYKSFTSPLYERYDKIDISLSKDEYKWIIDRMITDDSIQLIDIFCHSFSLLNWRANPDQPIYRDFYRKKLEWMLEYTRCKGVEYISEGQIAQMYMSSCDDGRNLNSTTNYSCGLCPLFFFARRAGHVLFNRLVKNI